MLECISKIHLFDVCDALQLLQLNVLSTRCFDLPAPLEQQLMCFRVQ
jgi:hypothetical protein